MDWFFWWLLLSVAVAVFARSKGRSAFGFFLLSLVLTPVIGFVFAVLARPVRRLQEERALADQNLSLKICPFCAELIKREAIKCRYCGSELGTSQ